MRLHAIKLHVCKLCTLGAHQTDLSQRRSDIGHHLTNYDLLMTFQAKLIFVFADSAVEHDWISSLFGYYVLIGLGLVTITDTKHN